MFAAVGSERVDPELSANALRDARQNSRKTKGVTLGYGSTLSTTDPIVNILRNAVHQWPLDGVESHIHCTMLVVVIAS